MHPQAIATTTTVASLVAFSFYYHHNYCLHPPLSTATAVAACCHSLPPAHKIAISISTRTRSYPTIHPLDPPLETASSWALPLLSNPLVIVPLFPKAQVLPRNPLLAQGLETRSYGSSTKNRKHTSRSQTLTGWVLLPPWSGRLGLTHSLSPRGDRVSSYSFVAVTVNLWWLCVAVPFVVVVHVLF